MLCRWVHTITQIYIYHQYCSTSTTLFAVNDTMTYKHTHTHTVYTYNIYILLSRWIVHQSVLATANPIQSFCIKVDELTHKTHLSISDRVNLPNSNNIPRIFLSLSYRYIALLNMHSCALHLLICLHAVQCLHCAYVLKRRSNISYVAETNMEIRKGAVRKLVF